MKIRFLGTGTSTGVPEIGCNCEVCQSDDNRDKRLRTSVLVSVKGKNILIDCGPDFRQQMLPLLFSALNGILISHEHYDHVGGLDDVRPFCRFGNINLYAEKNVVKAIKMRIPYCFEKNKYPGTPDIILNEIDVKPFYIEDIQVIPIRVMHHKLPILGFRIGNMAYLTDVRYIPEEEYVKLKNLDVLIINALRQEEHISHQTISQALENVKRIQPRKTYFIHMSHHFGLHAVMEKQLPDNVFISYDGLEVELR